MNCSLLVRGLFVDCTQADDISRGVSVELLKLDNVKANDRLCK